MNLWWLLASAVGLAILGAAVLEAREPAIPAWEHRLFHAVNGWPNWVFVVLWLPMQLGNLVVGTLAGLAVAVGYGDWLVGIGVVAAAILKLVFEKFIRRKMHAHLTVRTRPGTSQPGAILRGDVPPSGPSFPSGHIILVAAVGAVIAPVIPAGWLWAPVLAAVLVMVGRVYVGAHNPLDVTAGLGAGLALGGAIAVFCG